MVAEPRGKAVALVAIRWSIYQPCRDTRLWSGKPNPMPRRVPQRPEKIVIIGNCQAEIIAGALHHPTLGERFDVRYHFVDLPRGMHDRATGELAEANLLLVQDISNFDDYPLRGAIRPDAPVVRFPCLRLASLWPFDGQNGPDDKEARRREEAEPGMFTQFDGLLGRLRRQIPDPAARFEAYRSLAIGRTVNFARIHQLEEARLLGLDNQLGCTLGRLILDYFRAEPLFRATGHPGPRLYRALVQFILDRLGSGLTFPNEPELGDTDEVPVHPLVAAALGVSWANEHTRYRFCRRQVDWAEYVRTYIARFG
jgi:Polysaccharide biosynthesis enzyme WcbI